MDKEEELLEDLKKQEKYNFLRARYRAIITDGLETDRLILRHFTTSEARKFEKTVLKDKSVFRYSDGSFATSTRFDDDNEEWFEYYVDGSDSTWAIVEKETLNIVGCVEIGHGLYSRHQSGELGWIIDKRFRNKGYATEATVALITEYFDGRTYFGNRYKIFEASVNASNEAALKVCEKLGLHHDGILQSRRVDEITKEVCDLSVWSVTKEQWEAVHKIEKDDEDDY